MSELQNIIGAYSLCELEEKLQEAEHQYLNVQNDYSRDFDVLLEEHKKQIGALTEKWGPQRREKLKVVSDYRNAIDVAKKYGLGDETADYLKRHEDAGFTLKTIHDDGTEIWTRK